ncbi:hypothetical protein MKK67_11650 [Methylobacterium sp. J-072]|uniref:hypothetical protein n=1 Tax=Methylobacterium sp. J-072 TaxID=2836651 RepID=UPI001FBB59BA|nr:hypothetical protein [Methylobacterium sp. J-072]MCJ2093146.1 hypothetical protein [Methylobacterium sp. J-072]
MSKPARGSLSSLSDRLAPKAGAAPAATAQAAADPAPFVEAAGRAASSAQRDLKTMMCRVNRAGWQEMSRLAIDTGENLEDLLIEACNDLLRKNGRPPVIEKRSPSAGK